MRRSTRVQLLFSDFLVIRAARWEPNNTLPYYSGSGAGFAELYSAVDILCLGTGGVYRYIATGAAMMCELA